MRLYLAGNFTITDEIRHEVALKKKLGKDYNRLCTFYYPKAADVITKNEKPKIPKKVIINENDLNTKTHPALKGDYCDQEEIKNKKEKSTKKTRITTPKRRIRLRKKSNS